MVLVSLHWSFTYCFFHFSLVLEDTNGPKTFIHLQQLLYPWWLGGSGAYPGNIWCKAQIVGGVTNPPTKLFFGQNRRSQRKPTLTLGKHAKLHIAQDQVGSSIQDPGTSKHAQAKQCNPVRFQHSKSQTNKTYKEIFTSSPHKALCTCSCDILSSDRLLQVRLYWGW